MKTIKIEVIDSFKEKLATIISYEPYFATNKVEVEYENGEKQNRILYSESYDLCLRTPKNLERLAELREITQKIKELRSREHKLTKEMEDVVNAEGFKAILVGAER